MQLYHGADGQWRMLQKVHNGEGAEESHLVLYNVNFSRTSPRGADLQATFTPIDSLTVIPVSQAYPAFTVPVVVQDTVRKRDFMVLRYRPNFSQWVTERFDLTDGKIVASGDRVVGLEMLSTTDMPSLGHMLGTSYPVFHSSTATDGQLYFSIYDLVHPIAQWLAGGSGVQPVAGRAIINDQTGDGQPDMVISGGDPAALILLTLDTTIVSVDEQHLQSTDFSASISGTMLSVQTTRSCSITIDIAAVDGRAVYTSPLTPIEAGNFRHDLAPVLQPLAAGGYFVRVRCDEHMVTIPIQR